MIEVKKNDECCGCTACANICPHNAINMMQDCEGFLYPSIDKIKCIDCGLCEKVCPVTKKILHNSEPRNSYIVRTKKTQTLKESTSGGFVFTFLEYILNSGGIVCAATYGENFQVQHMIFESCDNPAFKSVQGSKYVQSSLGNCFFSIKQYLKQEKKVCFVGTTCQIYGLKAYLKNDYNNLITIDLVCHGTPSPKLWKKYLDYQRTKYNSEIIKISFRDKKYGYHSSVMKICFKNGKHYSGSARVDYMLKSFFTEISSRPICYKCPFKILEHCSDFTVYDCWHASQLVLGLTDDDKGFTNVIVQSKKGNEIMNKIKDKYEMHQVNTEKAIQLDGIMLLKSAKQHPCRKQFYKELALKTLPETVQKFIPVSLSDKIIEWSKGIFFKIKLFKIIKRIKNYCISFFNVINKKIR